MSRYIYAFDEEVSVDDPRSLLGGKGTGLAEMTQMGIPIPCGFTITTKACQEFIRTGLISGLEDQVREYISRLEAVTNRKFGDPNRPLLISVRSGAPISMPGMMDTILNIGLNDEVVAGLAEETQNEEFADNCYSRLKTMYQETVGDILPHDVWAQLHHSIHAVFSSWNNERARKYRQTKGISDSLGTAVNVMQMVFGNRGMDSASGVCFTRDPSTGEKGLWGEFLINSQGEDVVAGLRTPDPVENMKAVLPDAYSNLLDVSHRLENHYQDVQDIEFTVENGQLYLLQTRSAKRTSSAARKIAFDMVTEGLITPGMSKERLREVEESAPNVESVTNPFILSAKWLTPDHTMMYTSPKGIDPRFRGIITSLGGKTSHAVVVAREFDLPCIIVDPKYLDRIKPGDKVEITPDGVVHVNGGDPNFVKSEQTEDPVSAVFRFVFSNGEGRVAKIDSENINAPGTGHFDLLNDLIIEGHFSFDDVTTVAMGYINDDGSVDQDMNEISDQEDFLFWTQRVRTENDLPLGNLRRVDIAAYVK